MISRNAVLKCAGQVALVFGAVGLLAGFELARDIGLFPFANDPPYHTRDYPQDPPDPAFNQTLLWGAGTDSEGPS